MSIAADELTLRVADADGRLDGVRLRSDLFKRDRPPAFVRDAESGDWVLRLDPPPTVQRFEYMLELVRAGGASDVVPDPGNPLRARGPFGDQSVLELPGYAPPAWLDDEEAPHGRLRGLRLRSRRLRADVGGFLWSPADTDPAEPLPLLVVHDGPEYAEYSELLQYLDSATAELEVPPLRAALIAPVPGERNEHYSASARYSTALVRELLPALERRARGLGDRRYRFGMGASLGALAMMHAHRMHPDSFGGLFLQSGSFFRQRFDRYERGFTRFGRIARFVGTVLRAESWPHAVPVAMTCGTGEENLANNRLLRDALARQGYEADLEEHPDAHNWVSWRDVLDPHLTNLLQRLWG